MALKLRSFAEADQLKRFQPDTLIRLLDPHRLFFEMKGFALPATEGGSSFLIFSEVASVISVDAVPDRTVNPLAPFTPISPARSETRSMPRTDKYGGVLPSCSKEDKPDMKVREMSTLRSLMRLLFLVGFSFD